MRQYSLSILWQVAQFCLCDVKKREPAVHAWRSPMGPSHLICPKNPKMEMTKATKSNKPKSHNLTSSISQSAVFQPLNPPVSAGSRLFKCSFFLHSTHLSDIFYLSANFFPTSGKLSLSGRQCANRATYQFTG